MLQNTTDPEERELIKFAANTLYAGGTDTITASIAVFFLAMTLYPEVQKKAQREIDDVIGKDRLPCLADRDKLPYLGAVYNEVLRWQSIGPVGKTPALTADSALFDKRFTDHVIGIPHYTCEDDTYMGYYIPKGSVVIANIW